MVKKYNPNYGQKIWSDYGQQILPQLYNPNYGQKIWPPTMGRYNPKSESANFGTQYLPNHPPNLSQILTAYSPRSGHSNDTKNM